MAFVPAAAEAVGLADLAIGLSFLLVFLVLRGLLSGWQNTFGALLEALAGALRFHISIHGIGKTIDLGGPIRALDNGIQHGISAAAATSEQQAGRFFHAAAVLQRWIVGEVVGLAFDTLALAHWLTAVAIPRYAGAAVKLAFPEVWLYRKIASVVAGELVHVVKLIKAAAHTTEVTVVNKVYAPVIKRVTTVERIAVGTAGALAGTIGGTITGDVSGLWRRVAELWRARTIVNKRLHRVETLFGVTAMAAAMANVLGLPNWRCLTRGNIGRASRALCGLGAAAFEDLLGLLVDVLIVEDICKVITLLEGGLSIIQGPLNKWVTVVDGALCHGDYNAPPTDGYAALSLPPVTGVALSLPPLYTG
jgi:hypothetical protein